MIYLFENFNKAKIASDLTEELYKITDQLYFNKVVVVQASVKVSESKEGPIKFGDLYIPLIKLSSMNNEPGSGKKGMSALIKFADEHNLPIILNASSYMGSDLDRLTKFYKDFGFEVIEEFSSGRKMIRNKKEDK